MRASAAGGNILFIISVPTSRYPNMWQQPNAIFLHARPYRDNVMTKSVGHMSVTDEESTLRKLQMIVITRINEVI